MTHDDFIDSYLSGVGTEIGASNTPISGISPIYIDKFETFAGIECLADYPGDALSLPFFDSSLDYVATSHVLEHLANPVKALIEWERVLKPGGYAYMVIPDRRYTFDRSRNLTPPLHLVQDYLAGKDDTDDTHIDDFVFSIDWRVAEPPLSMEEEAEERKANATYHHDRSKSGLDINIHFHVFEPSNFLEALELCRQNTNVPFTMATIKIVERFPETIPNGFLIVLQKPHKPRTIYSKAAAFVKRKLETSSSYPVDVSRLGEFQKA